MKGKVTCSSCGWSWNKSDSSQKDMHVCHNCGKSDVNMKNGGWLDNYNDSKTSAPKGFQGDGYSNVGRNYSPAWGGQFQSGGYLKKQFKKTEKDLLKKYVDPVEERAFERAKQQGINTGIHNGPLDAIRHSSSAAAMSSVLPDWTNFIPGVAPLKILATNVAGAAHEIGSPNTWKEHASDLYNNFIGSVVGVLPISEESKHDLLIQAQKHGVLSDMGDKIPSAPKLPQLKLPPLPKRQMGGSVYPVNYVPQAQTGISNIFGNMMGGRNTSQYEMYGDDQAGGLNTFNPHYTRPAKTQTVAPQQEVAHRPFSDYRSVNAMPVNYNQHAISMRDRQFLGEMPMRGETLMPMRGPSWGDPPRYRDEYDVEPRHTEWRSDSRFDMIPLSLPNPAGPTRFTEYPSAELPTIRQLETKDGKQSWNIQQKNTRMRGRGGSYDDMNINTTDPEQVKRALQKAEQYNNYIQKQYGNSKNPKAIERLNTLRNDVEITPQYQGGGSVYPVNYIPQAAMGASMPGAVGFTYARTQSPALDNGKYAKKTMASAQNGVDMHGSPITAIEKHRYDIDRSYYDPRTNTMNLGNDYNVWYDYNGKRLEEEELKNHQNELIAHENRHAWQFDNDRSNFDIAHHTDQEQWARMQKKPQMMTNDNVWNSYHNRSGIEAAMDIDNVIPFIPETKIIPEQVSRDKIFQKIVDPQRYRNPNSLEGEATYYEYTGYDPDEKAKLASPKFQNGGEMRYYQNGLDWKPKGMDNGGWLGKYEQAQKGIKFNPKQFVNDFNLKATPQQRKLNASVNKEAQSEDYRRWVSSAEYQNAVKAEKAANDKAILAERKANIAKADKAKLNQWSTDILNPSNWTRQNVADAAAGLGDKARLFPNDPNNFIDDYLNPGVMFGDMASDLGSAPLRAQQEDSYMPYVTAIGTPLVTGALEGLGTTNNRQFVNNLINPFNAVPGYHSAKKYIGNKLGKISTSITPELRQSLRTAGFPNPLAAVDKIVPRLPYPGMIVGMEGSWNNLSPLNLIPGYGNKLSAASSHPRFVGFRKFGNSIQDVVESQSLRPKGTGMGSSQVMSEGNWAEPGKVNENYSGVFEATMNPQIEGSNIKLEKWRNRNGIVGTTQEGDAAIPLTDPGLSFNRRLPFSNRYVPIDKQKLIDDQFQLATQLPHVQSLIEKYGLWAGGAGAAGYLTGGSEGAKENINTFNDYTINPIIDQVKRQMEASPLSKKKQGGIIKDDRGQWAHPGKVTEIGSNKITMKGVPFNVIGISDEGDVKMMVPGNDYKFKGKKVTEFPMAKNGRRQEQKGLQNLEDLTNFTNYSKPQPGGWLEAYK